MRWLHDWYKGQANPGTIAFGVILPKYIYHGTSRDQMWVGWDCLFQLFQKRDLDVQILSLWTLMEAHHCKLKNKTDIAFLDPVIVNEKTCKGIWHDACETITKLLKVFKECKDKESILLAYNCDFYYIFLDIKLHSGIIKVYNSKRRPLKHSNPSNA
ncbi:hypothetical protein BAE44_0003761 [Dichanthelium oligosanthes]|uniref:Ubiquitin-like protease family profile domain-containing protein n=1 Tax=Dichanthelium oligosanthes TaxID=888268 RepID=A0A1E5WD95_9POAL|nr:hypothetical protein BAE44_0003761 [Dichanthelium oligosanthes]